MEPCVKCELLAAQCERIGIITNIAPATITYHGMNLCWYHGLEIRASN